MDAATGLLYVGNGQYYDPSTGRFLNRNARPDQANPYVPSAGDATALLIAPFILLSMVYSRRRGKRTKWDNFVILFVICTAMGMSLAACGGAGTTQPTEDSTEPHTYKLTQTATYLYVERNGTEVAKIPTPAATPTNTPTITCTMTFTPSYEPIPEGFDYYYNMGKGFYDSLEQNKDGWWHHEPGRSFNMQMAVAIALNYEWAEIGMWHPETREWIAEAFARKFWDYKRTYGTEVGAYIYLGGREITKFHQSSSDIPRDKYRTMDEAIELSDRIFNDSGWKSGWKWERPYEWGNVYESQFEWLRTRIPDFVLAVENYRGHSELDRGLWYLYRDDTRPEAAMFYIVSYGQQRTLRGILSCVNPDLK